jgi:restriction system protein
MGPSGGGQRRAFELEAYQTLCSLWRAAQRTVIDASNWDSACEMLRTYYTVAQARQDSEVCAMRIHYLEVSEPAPRLAGFVPAPTYTGVPDAPRQLARARYEFNLARARHPQREQQRLKELETTRALYTAMRAAEARARAAAELARRREWLQSRWPEGVVLEREIYNLDSLADQVNAQNATIESQIQALTGLLRDGLAKLPDASACDLSASYRAGDEAAVAAHVDSVLAKLPVAHCVSPVATVSYAAQSRELVVEYQLPTVDVIPTAQAYRYDKDQEAVVETERPASQVKTVYASTIAQLTLLALAAILTLDIERHIDVVVFNGVVEALDPGSGLPIRPCLITARVTADAFAAVDVANADPSTCLDRLSATVSANPAEFVPVRPLPE